MFGVSGLPVSFRSVAPGTVPAVNVGRTPTSVEIYAFAPALDSSKIEVTLDPAQVNATYKDGVLRVSVARRESAQPKRITVQ